MDLANTRIPNPEEVEGDYFDLSYIAERAFTNDGYWEPVYGIKRYRKLRLSRSYTTWIEDREIND